MSTGKAAVSASSRYSIIGFACTQGFVFSLFYLGTSTPLEVGGLSIELADLLTILLCMFATCVAITKLRPKTLDSLFSWNIMWACGIVMAAATVFPLISTYAPDFGVLAFLLHSLAVGVPTAIMLCSWGRAFGEIPVDRAVRQVFIGSALGALVCFVCAIIPIENFTLVLRVLSLGSAWALSALFRVPAPKRAVPTAEPVHSENALSLGGRVLSGALVYGLATGLMESLSSLSGMHTVSNFTITFFIFAAFCIGAIRLFGNDPHLSGEKVLPVNDALSPNTTDGPLDGSYRIALLVMLAGFLLNPVLSTTELPGEVIVLAGYLGIETVMISLFVIMGKIAGRDSTLTFALGFAALFLGEIGGVLIGNLVLSGHRGPTSIAVICAVAGIAALCAYLFLFTNRDLRMLSVVVEQSDRLESVCNAVTEKFGLSKREAEILSLAMRGRTGERIAGELFISKNTVETHLRRIYAKCGVHSRQELIDLTENMGR